MNITPYPEAREYELDAGVLFRDMQTFVTGTRTLSVGTASFDPGRYLPCHRHNCEEVIVILEGEAFVDVEGQRTYMRPYDSSHVPEGVPHRFVNASKERPLTILWIYSVTDVLREVTVYGECMGDQPPEPGEDGYIPSRPPDTGELRHLIEEITKRVLEALSDPAR